MYKPDGVKLSKYEISNKKVEVFDKVGIISGEGIVEGYYSEYVFKHDVRFTDIFLKEDGNWKYYKSHVTKIKKDVE